MARSHFPFAEAAMCVACGTVFAKQDPTCPACAATGDTVVPLEVAFHRCRRCNKIIPKTRLYCATTGGKKDQCKTDWWNAFRFHKRTY
jgi:RNA polymerase subunit RPABC4/transcription elongation factor Spt4